MAAISSFSHRVVLLLSLALCGGGAYVAYSETRSYLSGGATPQERFTALADGEQAKGLSLASTRLILDNCHEALSGVYGRLQPKVRRGALASGCLTEADIISQAMPSHSYAWYIGALAASQIGDYAGLVDRLRQSQLTGPAEQWIAEHRVGLAEDNLDRLPEDVRGLNDHDLALLVTSSRGVASIARRYIGDPSFRERITAIVEQLPNNERRRFIDYVQAAAE